MVPIFFLTQVWSLPCLVSQSKNMSMLLLRLDLSWPWCLKIKASSPKVTQSRNISLPRQLLSVLTAMLLTMDQNKSYIVDASKICHIDSSQLQQGFAKNYPWICQRCYMDLSKLSHRFVKVCTWICQVIMWICWSYWLDFSELLYVFLALC